MKIMTKNLPMTFTGENQLCEFNLFNGMYFMTITSIERDGDKKIYDWVVRTPIGVLISYEPTIGTPSHELHEKSALFAHILQDLRAHLKKEDISLLVNAVDLCKKLDQTSEVTKQ